ncbi:Chaperone SurA [invertebrate metagenome]|uniref:Chaperone SurA n=1 Tax=invertebrate metagenome TaxID=1711999 RepID=A0A2H9T661_9ZZZZ
MIKGWKQRGLAALGLLLVGVQVYAPLAGAKVNELDRIAAIVDKDVVMQSELDARLAAVYRQYANKDAKLPPESQLRQQLLDQLILDNIQMQIAERSGIRVDDWALNDAIEKIARRNGMTVPQFRDKLVAEGIPFADARDDIRQEMLINRIRQRQVAERIYISDQEIDNYLKSPEGKARMQVQYRLSHILIEIPENASAADIQAAKEKVQMVEDKLVKGASFAEMAMAYSQGQNAMEGGDLGWQAASVMPEMFVQAAENLKKGEVSAPVKSTGGFHIFRLLDSRGSQKHIEHQVHVRHILIKPNEIRNDLETKMQAEKIYQRIKKGEDFSDLAKAYSEDKASALAGGDMGWKSPAIFVEEFRDAIKVLPENKASEPFKTTYGWHVMEVLGKRDADISERVQRSEVREILSNRKFQEELAVWLREIRDQAYVEVKPVKIVEE